MTEIKLSLKWRNRLMRWARDLILIFGMWSIWLVRVYTPDIIHANIITGFQIAILAIVIIYEEYTDTLLTYFESELYRLKSQK
jgi:hypothetical protein